MSQRSRLVAGLAATVTMAVGVGAASANRLSISHGALWRETWANVQYNGSLGNVAECAVTFEGSFHSGVATKVAGALTGYIAGATIAGPYRRERASFLREPLPWHVTYDGFTGRPPFIERIRALLVGASLRLGEVPLLGECLARTETNHPAVEIARVERYEAGGNGIITSATIEEGARIPCVNGANSVKGSIAGPATVTEVPGGSANLLIRLI